MPTVTADGWSVSVQTGGMVPGASLSVFKVVSDSPYKVRRGDADKMQFPSREAAWSYALDHGYIREHVTPWCRKCRRLHTYKFFNSSRIHKSGFCDVHKEFCR